MNGRLNKWFGDVWLQVGAPRVLCHGTRVWYNILNGSEPTSSGGWRKRKGKEVLKLSHSSQ